MRVHTSRTQITCAAGKKMKLVTYRIHTAFYYSFSLDAGFAEFQQAVWYAARRLSSHEYQGYCIFTPSAKGSRWIRLYVPGGPEMNTI